MFTFGLVITHQGVLHKNETSFTEQSRHGLGRMYMDRSASTSIQFSKSIFAALDSFNETSIISPLSACLSISPVYDHQLSSVVPDDVKISGSLQDLQTEEQRRILDTVDHLKKCGLESILSFPQMVVCGDQSSGKSSVIEALTEIPVPRNDNLCTRYATEIHLVRATVNSLTIKIIADNTRPTSEQTELDAFEETITDFKHLPDVMSKAMTVMGIAGSDDTLPLRAFARDVLKIVIEGPDRPQLTFVDIPGLIATSTRGVTKADVELVEQITTSYISQHRTICLAIVSATNDYANQKILEKVRDVDPEGDRTLGIITKPDGLPKDSGAEKAFIDLASNKDIFFKLGWHVLKNRKFEERDFTFMERNSAEATFFGQSNFRVIAAECRGIGALRLRLSDLLFEHIKRELSKLREDLDTALKEARSQLQQLGNARSTVPECRNYLSQLSYNYGTVCRAAIEGHYENRYFRVLDVGTKLNRARQSDNRRIRARIQNINTTFAAMLESSGKKYLINMQPEDDNPLTSWSEPDTGIDSVHNPTRMCRSQALRWVGDRLKQTRGKELIGTFNPLLIGELFWEQSEFWESLAKTHVAGVTDLCEDFLSKLLRHKSSKDVEPRIWTTFMQDALKQRSASAFEELDKLMIDLKKQPINYNHSFTENIDKSRKDKEKAILQDSIQQAAHKKLGYDADAIANKYFEKKELDMENVSCEAALECLFAIYKVKGKVFVDNVATQVIERHIIDGLDEIFSPVKVNALSDAEVAAIASEPPAAKRHREFLTDRIAKLEAGATIFRKVMGGGSSINGSA